MKRTMKRLNTEMSPLRDDSTKDPYFVREMWEQYTRNQDFMNSTNDDEVRRQPEQVHAYLKRMESGADHPDAKIINDIAQGNITTT
jgi:hypothetical protein